VGEIDPKSHFCRHGNMLPDPRPDENRTTWTPDVCGRSRTA
jgi:hypothetical protein